MGTIINMSNCRSNIMSIIAYQLELAGETPYKRIGFLVHQDID
ncbi:hypothetical protein ASZ90_008717 [hydrocarbon metagenome]|uniref:Uncharacterized protein n=1 Tax=hydrocarbon metagenome TaxID=938273 RepID=A0A0W8FKS8_9ZZZZ